MAFSISPAVTFTEKDLTGGIPAVATTEAGIAGPFRWGPLNERVLISNEDELKRYFWKPDSNCYNSWFSASNFLAYSNNLWVVRVADEAASGTRNATGGSIASLSGTAAANGDVDLDSDSTTVEANTGTPFQYLYTGDVIVINGEARKITAKANSTSVTVNTAPSTNASGVTVYAYGKLIKNDENYDGTSASVLDDFGFFAARYPGSLGNSLRVAVCDSSVAFSNSISGICQIGVSDSSNTIIVTPTDVSSLVTVNKSQFIFNGVPKTITAANSTTVTIESSYGISANSTTCKIAWEFFSDFDQPPGTSTYASGRGSANDEIHIAIIDNDGTISGTVGTILEKFEGLSKAPDAKDESGQSIYYKTVINNSSAWLRWLNHPGTSTTNWGSNTASGLVYATNNSTGDYVLYGGYDSNDTVDNDDYIRGYNKFADGEEVDISFIITGNTNAIVINYCIDNIATVRKDCIVFCSPESSDVVNITDKSQIRNIIDFRNTLSSGTYAFMDGNYKYQYDKYNDVSRWVPLNGDICGLAARSNYELDPWWSMAGYNRGKIKNVIKLAFNPSKAERDQLYKNAVNPVISESGEGVVLLGDKMLTNKQTAFNRYNVRMLFITIEKAISTFAKYQLFEFNNSFTRLRFRSIVDPYLRRIQGGQGIYDFRVIADETNNTGEVIDQNGFVGDIYIKPARSINFIQLNFIAVATAVEFEEIITNS